MRTAGRAAPLGGTGRLCLRLGVGAGLFGRDPSPGLRRTASGVLSSLRGLARRGRRLLWLRLCRDGLARDGRGWLCGIGCGRSLRIGRILRGRSWLCVGRIGQRARVYSRLLPGWRLCACALFLLSRARRGLPRGRSAGLFGRGPSLGLHRTASGAPSGLPRLPGRGRGLLWLRLRRNGLARGGRGWLRGTGCGKSLHLPRRKSAGVLRRLPGRGLAGGGRAPRCG